MKKILLIIFSAMVIPFSTSAQIVANGSFEQGITQSWTHSYTSGQATFAVEQTEKRHGNQGLKVNVAQTGSGLTAISSVNNSFNNTGESVFLVRFWAKSSVDETDLTVAVQGAQTDQVHFKIRSHWVLYHLPFESTETALNLTFYYEDVATYYIDGVEILDQNNGSIDVYETLRWNEKFAPGWGWTAGDNDISLKLPDGRVVWFFNDSFYGYNDPSDNPFHNSGARFLRNAMVVQESDGLLYSRYSGTQSNTTRYFEVIEPSPEPGVDNFYWVGDAIMDEGKVKVYLVELLNRDGAVPTERSYIAQFSYPALTLENIARQPAYAYGYESFFADGNYIYLYKTENDGVWDRYTHVARTTKGNLLGQNGAWQFYNGSAWVTDPAQSVRVNNAGAESFVKLQDGNYAQVSQPVLSREIRASFAQHPEGPWTPSQLVYTIPDDEQYWTYLPNLHGRLANGKYSVSYSVNSWEDWTPAWNDKFWYRQRYIQVDLMGLSPYTANDCAGVYGGNAYLDVCGECVEGTTGKLPCDVNIALLKPTTVSSVEGTNNGALAVDGNSATRWESTYNDPQWIQVDFGKTYTLSRVKIQWETACGKDYQIQLSDNGTTWTSIKTITNNAALLNDHTGLVASGRYLRIYGTARATMWGYSIYELEAYGKESGAAQDITDLGGIASSQYNDSPANEGITNLVDNNASTKYLTFHNAAWVQYQAPGPYIVKSYSITSANDAPERDPLNWTLQGSANGTTWVTLDTRSNEDFPGRFQKRSFSFSNPVPYTYYRLNLVNNSGTILQLAEVELFGTPGGSGGSMATAETSSTAVTTVIPDTRTLAYPVPFEDEISIPVTMKTSGEVRIGIYSLSGEEKIVLHRSLSEGTHLIRWNGEDGRGQRIHPGMYMVKVKDPGGVRTLKIIKK